MPVESFQFHLYFLRQSVTYCNPEDVSKSETSEVFRFLYHMPWVRIPLPAPTTNLGGSLGAFGLWMRKQGFRDATITAMVKHLKILGHRTNLDSPELVRETIATTLWSDGFKRNLSNGYYHYARWRELSFERMRYEPVEKLPFVPLETEVDTLVHSIGRKTGTVLQLLKETGARIGEAWTLGWTDVDLERGIVTITPEKESHARQLKISPKLCGMLTALPRRDTKVFGWASLDSFRREYEKQRRKIAARLSSPRLNQIKLHTFRHFKATMEYHRTKDLLHVQRILGHRGIKNTLRYTQLVDWKSEDFACKVAKTLEEASSLIEAGFEYVTEMDGMKLFRKRKQAWVSTVATHPDLF